MEKAIRFLLMMTLALAVTAPSFALTAVAVLDGHADETWWVSSNYESQKEADKTALAGCRSQVRKNGLHKEANRCAVVGRAKVPGYGAITCGDKGCSWVIGAGDRQQAVDLAYDGCIQQTENCKAKDISNWEDWKGFAGKQVTQAPSSGDCRPRTTHLTCESQCTNGNCIVSYQNGCKMRVQVPSRLNPFNNQWEYPTPSC